MNTRKIATFIVIIYMCVCVCLSVLCMWYVILEHEDEGRANLETTDTIKMSIPISQSKLYFHVQRTHHNIHIYVSFDVKHNVET